MTTFLALFFPPEQSQIFYQLHPDHWNALYQWTAFDITIVGTYLTILGILAVCLAGTGQAVPEEKPQTLALELDGGVKLELVHIKAGRFQMGSPDSDEDAEKDEKPHAEQGDRKA